MTISLVALVGFVFLMLVLTLWAGKIRIDWRSTLETVARRLHLETRSGGLAQPAGCQGRIDGFGVVVDSYTGAGGKTRTTYTRVRVDGEGRVPRALVAEPRSVGRALLNVFVGSGFVTGDEAFDRVVSLRGPRADILAHFGESARTAAMEAIQGHGARLKEGQLSWETSGLLRDPDRICAVVRALVGLMSRLASDEPPAVRLRVNATTDPQALVRRQCLRHLLRDHPDSAEARRGAREAVDDEDPGVRLVAARYLGGERGAAVMRATAVDADLDLAYRREAVEALGREPAERAGLELLRRLVASGPVGLLAAAMKALRTLGQAVDAEQLAARLEELDADGRLEVVRALQSGAASAPEPLLLRLLEDAQETRVKIAIASALSDLGGRLAVVPLQREAEGLFKPGELKDAARYAIRRIQSRLEGADGGRLSLAVPAGTEGQLSLSESTAGALSRPLKTDGSEAPVEGGAAVEEGSVERLASEGSDA